MEQQSLKVTHFTKRKNLWVLEDINNDFNQICQNAYELHEIPQTHYVPMITIDETNLEQPFSQHQRSTVLRLAKSKRKMMDSDHCDNLAQKKKIKSHPCLSILRYNTLEAHGIRGIISPPASLLDFNGNDHHNENGQISPRINDDRDFNILEDMTILGPNKSAVRTSDLQLINLKSSGNATRGLLDLLFTFEELATHSLTGKPSPAFYGRERPKKYPLDHKKIEDITDFVTKTTGASAREIRQIITAKCADSAKKYRKRFKNNFTIHF